MRFDHDLMLSHVCGMIRDGIDRGRLRIKPELAIDIVVTTADLLGERLGFGSNSVDVEATKEQLSKQLNDANRDADVQVDGDRAKEVALVHAAREAMNERPL